MAGEPQQAPAAPQLCISSVHATPRSKVFAQSYAKTNAYPADFPLVSDAVSINDAQASMETTFLLGARLTEKSWASLQAVHLRMLGEITTFKRQLGDDLITSKTYQFVTACQFIIKHHKASLK
jgi:hypothetical protein